MSSCPGVGNGPLGENDRLDSTAKEKAAVRQKMRLLRENLTREDVERKSLLVQQLVVQCEEFLHAKSVGAYYPLNGETQTLKVIEQALRNDKAVFLPRVIDDRLQFFEVSDLGGLELGKFNIPEPPKTANAAHNLDILLVPGLGFDLRGHRLGYGKGFYDRFLKKFRGFSVGLGYEFQLVERLPTEAFDIRLSALVAGQTLLRFK